MAADAEFESDVAHINATFTKARTVVLINASLNVILELSGKEQITSASQLMMKKMDCLPKALFTELAQLAKK